MIQLGFFEMLGGWDYINTASDGLLRVTAEDITRIANKYFDESNSSVAIYRRSAGAEPIDEELAQFSPEQMAMVQQALAELENIPVEMLGAALENMRLQSSQVPPEMKHVFDYLLKKLEERIGGVSEPGVPAEGVEDPPLEDEAENAQEPESPPEPTALVLTPKQQAEADVFLNNISSMELTDVVRVYETLQGVANSVPDSDRPVVEFILARLAVHIAQLEQEEDN